MTTDERIAWLKWCADWYVSDKSRLLLEELGEHNNNSLYRNLDGRWTIGIGQPDGGYDRIGVLDYLAGKRSES